MTFFLDTNIVVYLIENPAVFGPRAHTWLAARLGAGDRCAVSDLVRMEARVRPLRLNDVVTVARFDAYFGHPDLTVHPLTAAVCDRATVLRATYNFKTADALQLAAAIVHGCDRFLTADARLNRCSDIPVDVLP